MCLGFRGLGLRVEVYMVAFINRGPEYRPQNIIIHSMGNSKSLILG